jgi:hypothetical protein
LGLACAPWLVYAPPWQESQRLLLTTVWFIVTVVKLVVLVWQLLQAIVATGMCGGVVWPCAPDVPWLV